MLGLKRLFFPYFPCQEIYEQNAKLNAVDELEVTDALEISDFDKPSEGVKSSNSELSGTSSDEGYSSDRSSDSESGSDSDSESGSGGKLDESLDSDLESGSESDLDVSSDGSDRGETERYSTYKLCLPHQRKSYAPFFFLDCGNSIKACSRTNIGSEGSYQCRPT